MVPQLDLSCPYSKLTVEIYLKMRQIMAFSGARSPVAVRKGTVRSHHGARAHAAAWCMALRGWGEPMGLHPGSAGLCSLMVWKSISTGKYLLPLSQRYFTKQRGKKKKKENTSIQLSIPKCLLCHLLSLLKPSLKASLETGEKRPNSLASRQALCISPANCNRAAAGRGAQVSAHPLC